MICTKKTFNKTKIQYVNRKYCPDFSSESLSHQAISKQENYQQLEQTRSETIDNLDKKNPSQLVTFIFVIVAISIYGFGIHQLGITISNILDTVVQEVNKDYRFNIF